MRRHRIGLEAGVWLVLAACPLLINRYYVDQLSQFVVYGMFAMSLALVWGQAGLLCFGQAVFFGMGGYVMALVTKGMIPHLALTSSYAGLLGAVLVPAVVASILGRFLFYGRGLAGAHFAIVTLSVAVLAERLATTWGYIGGNNGLRDVPPIDLGVLGLAVPIVSATASYYFALSVAMAVYVLLSAVLRTPYGSVIRAIRENDERSAFFGYDTSAYKRNVFAAGAGIAGLAGGIFVAQFGFVSPTLLGVQLSTEVLIWVALGGKAALLAAFLGAVVVRAVESVLSETLGYYWLLALGLVFVATVLWFPVGLLGGVLSPRLGKGNPGRGRVRPGAGVVVDRGRELSR